MTGAVWTSLVVAVGVASALSVEAVRRLALRHDVMDVPNDRSSHVRPTPRGGGLAVVLAVAAAWAVAAALDPSLRALGVAVAVAVVAAVSAADDVWSLPTGPRFAAQGLAAAVLLASVGAWAGADLPLVGAVPFGPLGVVLAVLWLVGLTNAYNFMDGIDGIAGAQAVVAGTVWAVIGVGLDVPVVALLGGLVASASAGFLVHNWSPARIFMGDVGAASLGFLFAALPLAASDALPATEALRMPLAGLLAVWPFVFDTVSTVVQRARRGERLTEAHRSHLYQRLVAEGWSHRRVASLYAGLAAVSGSASVAWAFGWAGSGAGAVGVVLAVPACARAGLRIARRQERVRRGDAP